MDVTVRLLGDSDSIPELTALLHRAYAALARMGFNYTAVDQDDAVTRNRIRGNDCFVALAGRRILGTVTLERRIRDRPACASTSDVGYISQFAVDPGFQRRGLGSLLLDTAERRARELGYASVGLDTAEGAAHLVRTYERRGYVLAGRVQFPGKTYRSVVFLKTLREPESPTPS